MFNLTHIFTCLQASTPITSDFSREHSGVVPKDPSTKYQMLCLITVTAMVFFYIRDCLELRNRGQRRENRLAVLEDGMMDIKGSLLPLTGCPLLDEDDDFKLPPPAYELPEEFLED